MTTSGNDMWKDKGTVLDRENTLKGNLLKSGATMQKDQVDNEFQAFILFQIV